LIKIIKELNIEVTKPNVFQAIVAKQYDMNTRFIKATFVDCGERIDIPNSPTLSVVINAERIDGQSKGFDGEINEDGTVTVPLHSWMLELEGTVICDISVIDTATDNEQKLTTTSFTLIVEKAAYGGDDVTSDPQYDVLIELIKQVENFGEVASAVKKTVKGSNIVINDISPLKHTVVVEVDKPEGNGNSLTFEATDFLHLRSNSFNFDKEGNYRFDVELFEGNEIYWVIAYDYWRADDSPNWNGNDADGYNMFVGDWCIGYSWRIFLDENQDLNNIKTMTITNIDTGEILVSYGAKPQNVTVKEQDGTTTVYTAKNGKVEFASVYPTIEITNSDNANMTCTYNADTGKAVAEAQNFKQLFDAVTVTQEAFDEAGEEGIKVISIGDENIDLSLYDEILISLKVPNSSGINTSNSLLRCYFSATNNYSTEDKDWFIYTQSEGLSTNCAIRPDWNNVFTIKGVWKEDMFLYGEVIRNGWSNACGYTGVITGWNNLHEGFKKSSKKYIHFGTTNNFKFPVGTTVNVYGR
jgi:hypothetical protein